MKNNIALFGGSFDPVHLGHTAVVEALKGLDFIDKVVIMPTYLNPFKSHFVADGSTRIQWLQELYKDDPKVEVSSFEVQQGKKVPTITTVKYLKKFYDTIYLVIGADNLATLQEWYRYDELKELVKLIVATRDNIPVDEHFITLHVTKDISSTQLRKKIDTELLPPKIARKIEKFYKEHNAKQN